MSKVIKVAKIGKSTNSTEPNDFVFHSDYNTFKIIKEGTKSVTHDGTPATQTFTQWHTSGFIPLVSAFITVDGESYAYPPNGYGVSLASAKALVTNGVRFDYVEADYSNITFSITTSSSKNINIRYFLLEEI